MPKQKDLKRLVRARMEKTGESYTTARRRLLEKKASPRPGVVPLEKYAALAGMADEAVRAKTGRTWEEWVIALDAIEAARLPHREIAAHLRKQGLSSWWSQTVTVGYERIRGLRDVGQERGGGYAVNRSKTLPVAVSRLYRAFDDERLRRRWLPDVEWTLRTAVPDRSLRITWPDGTWVLVSFLDKGERKSTVTVRHERLPDRERAEEERARWGERLAALAELLATSG